MADSVKFVINIEKKIDDKEMKKIKKDIEKKIRKDLKKEKVIKKEKDLSKKSVSGKSISEIRRPLASSSSPVAPPPDRRTGGIYGRTDPGVKGFQGRKGIRGGITKPRNDRERAPHQPEYFRDMIARIEKNIHTNTISSGAIEKLIKNHMGEFVRGSQILGNPQEFVGHELLRGIKGIGPYGGPIVAGIIAILAIPEVTAKIIKILSQKGLPLNRDWKRIIEDEVNSLLSIEGKKKRLLGIDSYIVSQTNRYQPESGSTTYNSLENRDEVIISKIGLAEKAVGAE